jgi:hypothetical protein
LIQVFILVIFFASAQAYDNVSLENDSGQNALASSFINSANSSLPNGMLNTDGSHLALAGNISLIAENSAIQFINQSTNFDYYDSYNFRLANVSLNPKNRSNIDEGGWFGWLEGAFSKSWNDYH